jgi:hypothetical protein
MELHEKSLENGKKNRTPRRGVTIEAAPGYASPIGLKDALL